MSNALDPSLFERTTTVSREGLSIMAGIHVNPDLAIVARAGSERADYRYFVRQWPDGQPPRIIETLQYIEQLRALARDAEWPHRDDRQFLFQLDDNPVDVCSISWEARAGWRNVRLIPDLYYVLAGGYEWFNPELQPWAARRPSIVWRGSSTGAFQQTEDGLDQVPRYRMCKIAAQLGDSADVGLTDLVQAASPHEEARIRERVVREGLFKPFVSMIDMARHRYILDIDGNSNSWNFMQKLRLGCCVLRVESDWRQWFADRLIAWEHYVPIALDLSDLVERAEWCFANPKECSAIATHGKQFALDMKFPDEMSRAASTAFAAPKG